VTVPKISTRQGFRYQDELELARISTWDPEVQLFTAEDFDDEVEPKMRKYWCAVCKSGLDYLQGADEWFCSQCGQQYDPKIQDVPIKDLSTSKVRVWAELAHYPIYEENDPYLPFAEGIDMDDIVEEEKDIQLISSSPDLRIQKIRVKGDISKALSAQHYFE
jgi:DNA-directed RNA polymerase subunit RPC12/RpoP